MTLRLILKPIDRWKFEFIYNSTSPATAVKVDIQPQVSDITCTKFSRDIQNVILNKAVWEKKLLGLQVESNTADDRYNHSEILHDTQCQNTKNSHNDPFIKIQKN